MYFQGTSWTNLGQTQVVLINIGGPNIVLVHSVCCNSSKSPQLTSLLNLIVCPSPQCLCSHGRSAVRYTLLFQKSGSTRKSELGKGFEFCPWWRQYRRKVNSKIIYFLVCKNFFLGFGHRLTQDCYRSSIYHGVIKTTLKCLIIALISICKILT